MGGGPKQGLEEQWGGRHLLCAEKAWQPQAVVGSDAGCLTGVGWGLPPPAH